VKNNPEISQEQFHHWIDISTSENFFIRKAALTAFGQVVRSPEKKLLFYRSYLKEENPNIVITLAEKAFQMGTKEGLSILVELEAQIDNYESSPSVQSKIASLQEALRGMVE
jgi:hypothetical protein